MKHVLAIGDLGDATSTPPATTPAAPRKAAGPAVWAQQSDGSWAIKWRTNDTWWDLSARYLQAGNRYKEIFNYQSDAFHARVSQPIAIYTGALVAMPPEAVKRAQLLGEAPSGGGGVQPSPALPPVQVHHTGPRPGAIAERRRGQRDAESERRRRQHHPGSRAERWRRSPANARRRWRRHHAAA